MFTAIMIVLGILGLVSNANGWFIVPDVCIYICFGVVVLTVLYKAFAIHQAKKKLDDWRHSL